MQNYDFDSPTFTEEIHKEANAYAELSLSVKKQYRYGTKEATEVFE